MKPEFYNAMAEALITWAGLFFLVVFLIVLHRLSGVPLNEFRNAHCPDGIEDRDSITPSDFGLTWKPVRIMGELGPLPAWFVAADQHLMPKKIAILVHGRGGTLASCCEVLLAFQKAGWSTLTISYRGDPGTTPSPDGLDHLGDTEYRDLQAAVELAYMAGAEEVCLYGRSAGGQIVGQFLKQGVGQYLSLVKHVILDDPVLDWRAVLLNNRPSWLPKWVGRLILWVSTLRIHRKMSHFDLVKNPPLHRPRTMIFHGRNDEVVPFSSTQRFMKAMDKQWKVALVETTATHGMSHAQDPFWYDAMIRIWLGDGTIKGSLFDQTAEWMKTEKETS